MTTATADHVDRPETLADLPARVAQDHALEHVKYMIANTPVRNYPYPHMAVHGVFPESYYSQILENFPGEEQFEAQIEGYPQRGTIELTKPGAMDRLPPKQRAFWNWLVQSLGSQSFMRFALESYSPLLASRFGHSIRPLMYLFRDTGGYGIGPHTDTLKKIVTMLFYLPEDDSQRHAGTSIVVPREEAYRHKPTGHETWDDYRPAKTIEFLPNTLASFVVTDRSLHAVRPTPPGTVRKSLQFFICQE
ncbi:MAG: 2OG-Fe(II) oxygenase [Phycisphaerales bacterium]